MSPLVNWSILILAAYLVGAIPFAYILGKTRGIDIRRHGSRNVGASNLGRVVGRRYGWLCFVLDVAKGFAPTFVAGLSNSLIHLQSTAASTTTATTTPFAPPTPSQQLAWIAVGIAAIIGHMFPIYLRFTGGKGVATSFGAMLGIYPYLTFPVLACLAVWVFCIFIFRIISLASMAAAGSLPIWIIIFHFRDALSLSPFITLTTLIALLIAFRHRTNLARLFAGAEPHIGDPFKPHESSH